MLTVHKYPLEITDRQCISMPMGARVLKVDSQNGQPMIWALVDTERMMADHFVRIVGTGHPAEESVEARNYLGTFFQGPLVWHVFAPGLRSASHGGS